MKRLEILVLVLCAPLAFSQQATPTPVSSNPNQRVQAWGTLPNDARLLSFFPHMHLRGDAFEYRMVTPEGRSSTLLKVNHYDFQWQLEYKLAEPLELRELLAQRRDVLQMVHQAADLRACVFHHDWTKGVKEMAPESPALRWQDAALTRWTAASRWRPRVSSGGARRSSQAAAAVDSFCTLWPSPGPPFPAP